jgi:hypothetical protein
MTWIALLAGAAGCYALKLLGLSLPRQVVRNGRVQRVAALLPVALLSALIVTQTFADGHHLVAAPRAAGLGVALIATALRAPFLAVVATAALVAALARLAVS